MVNEIKELQDSGLTRRQLVELFGIAKTNDFLDWMKGQTVGVVDGFDIYYYADIERFFLV